MGNMELKKLGKGIKAKLNINIYHLAVKDDINLTKVFKMNNTQAHVNSAEISKCSCEQAMFALEKQEDSA